MTGFVEVLAWGCLPALFLAAGLLVRVAQAARVQLRRAEARVVAGCIELTVAAAKKEEQQ